MAFHRVTGRRIVEVYDNAGDFVASIYPDEKTNGVKIVSKHISTFDLQATPAPPAILVQFFRQHERT